MGVVFRGQDLDNYYMIQIRTDRIVPHRRVAVPVVEKEKEKNQKKETKEEVSSAPREDPAPEEAPKLPPV